MSADPNFQPPSADILPTVQPGSQPPGSDATPEEKDLWWFRNVYQGDNQPQLTLRAVLMGGLLGMLLSISNLFTTLKLGWGFGVAITACVMSWAIWNGLRAVFNKLTPMSLLENNCMQSTASAAGYSTGSVVGSAMAALLMVQGTHISAWHMVPFVFLTAALGVFLAIPMKRQMINHEQLPFPSGIAAAETLRSLYSVGGEAVKKASALLWAMALAAVVGVVRQLPLIVTTFKMHFSEATVKRWEGFQHWMESIRLPFPAMPSVAPVGLVFDPSVLQIGAGMIIGLRTCLSMLAGSLILHYGLGPMLVENHAVKVVESEPGSFVANFFRWGVWGGTALMVMASLTALAFQWGAIRRSFSAKRGGGSSELARIEVPGRWMVWGLIPITLGLVWVLSAAFGVHPLLGLLSAGMSYALSLVACRATGETDVTPIGAMGKVTQLTYAGLTPGDKVINLMAAGTTSAAAASSADLLSDLKSGYILGANPRRQFLAQFAGILFGTLAIVPFWYLLVPDREALDKFPAPAANAWKAMADLLNPGGNVSALDTLPWGAGWALIIGSALGILLPVIERAVPAAKKFMPSAMGLGLGMLVDFGAAFGFTIGAVIAWIWRSMNKKQADDYTVPVGSGFVAGQGLVEALILAGLAAISLAMK